MYHYTNIEDDFFLDSNSNNSDTQEFWTDCGGGFSNEHDVANAKKPLREKNISGRHSGHKQHVPHSEKPPQVVEKRNARERRRVQAVNSAFVKLRDAVPIQNSRGKRISKVKTLLHAMDYIRALDDILRDCEGGYSCSYELVKESLCILIKYRLVTFKPNKNENLANYTLEDSKVLLMLRYPKYLNHIKKQFGDESEMIIEEVLQRGYWSASELILKVNERLTKTNDRAPSLTQIKDKLVYLINAKYLQRLPYSVEDRPVPNLAVEEHETHVLPNIEVKTLVAYQKDNSLSLPDKNIYWTVNFDRFHQDMRDKIIVTAFSRKFDENSGEIMKLFLRQMYIRTEPWADVSNPIPALEIKDILKRQASHSLSLAFFDQYINIIEQDNGGLLKKAGEASGGSYQIYLKEAFTQFAWELVEQIVLEKYDSKAARIFRLVKLKPYIEPDRIQQLAMIPAKEAKRLSYQLYEENFLHIQELRKTTANNGPTKNFTLFHIQLENVIRMLLEMCYKALFNHITRRNHERQLNKRIIDKKQRVDTILMGMRAQGATEEQLSDIEEMITPPEKEILVHVEKIMKKLNTVELEIDDTIFMLHMFLVYH